MPKIIIQANQSNADAGPTTLTERIVATHLQDDHSAAPLIERLISATIDAERLESPDDCEHSDERHGLRPTRPPGDTIPSRPRTPRGAGARRART
jgi:hypothetical protein